MDDIEYFNRRLKESDFVKRGFSPDQQISGGFTENHFGRNFSPTLNFTIYYDQANGKLSMYSCDPSSDITSVVTHNHLWGIFVFSGIATKDDAWRRACTSGGAPSTASACVNV